MWVDLFDLDVWTRTFGVSVSQKLVQASLLLCFTMGFPMSVKEEALVKAARHCCVCRRYKGINLEVHHIVPESEGGDNSFENAIPLCFDCHSAAGHYSPDHPKGNKLTRSELRKHRDEWYAAVEEGNISLPSKSPRLQARYLVCKSGSALEEIVQGDFGSIPVDSPILVRNTVFDCLRDLALRDNPTVLDGAGVPTEASGRGINRARWRRLLIFQSDPSSQ